MFHVKHAGVTGCAWGGSRTRVLDSSAHPATADEVSEGTNTYRYISRRMG